MKVRYYKTASGRSPVEEFLLGLPAATRPEIVDAIVLLQGGAHCKKTQQIPARELEVVLKRIKEI